MTETRRHLQGSSAMFWKVPRSWLPAIAAGLVSYAFGFLCNLLRRPMIYALSPKSVLGGVSVRLDAPILFAGTLLTWLPILLEVVLFVLALGMTAHYVGELSQHPTSKLHWRMPRSFRAAMAGTIFAGLIVLGFSVFLQISLKLSNQAYSREITAALFIVVGLPVLWFLLPKWQQYCAKNQQRTGTSVRLPAYVGIALALTGSMALDLFLRRVVAQLFVDLQATSMALSFVLNLLAAGLSQLPVAFGMIAISLPADPTVGSLTGSTADLNE